MAADTGSNPESQRSPDNAPAGGNSPQLSDFLDVGAVQALMDNFYKLTQISIGIIDLSGKVFVATNWQDICIRFHRVHPESCKHCIESDTLLSSGVQPGEHKLYKCRNNLWDMATPLVIGDLHIGNLFLGQFFFDDEAVDRKLFRRQAQQYGFDEDAYLKALERVPRWPREKVGNACNFFTRLAVVIAQLGHSNLSLARSLAERDQLLTIYKAGEQTFRSYIDNAPYGVFIADQNGRYMEVNTTAVRLSGYDQGELLAMGTERIVAPECRELAATHIRTVLENNVASDEIACITKDGRHRWWAVTSVRLSDDRLLTYTEDITERRQAETERKGNEALLALSQKIAHLGSWKLDLTANRLTWSDETYRIFGCRPQEFAATYEAFLDIVHPEDRSAVDATYAQSLKEASVGYESEHRIVSQDTGEVRYVHEQCIHERNANGVIIQSTGMVQDITERKQAELKQLEHLQELQRWHAATMGRESRVIELKREVNELLRRTGQPVRYPSATIG